jgi:hypothetical protein
MLSATLLVHAPNMLALQIVATVGKSLDFNLLLMHQRSVADTLRQAYLGVKVSCVTIT